MFTKCAISGRFKTFNAANATASMKRSYRNAWYKAIKLFLESIGQGIPVISGGTKGSFQNLADKYGANLGSFINGNDDFEYWTRFPPRDQEEATDDLSIEDSRSSWTIHINSQAFLMQEYGPHSYVRYWRKNLPPWPERQSERPEPWKLIPEAKAVALDYLRERSAVIFKSATAAGFSGRRGR